MLILAIETSCDETAVAIVRNGRDVLANAVASQIALHAQTGGVVPEVAAREHVKALLPTLKSAFEDAKLTWKDIDAIAVTKEPGLVGSLIVGRMSAAALAFTHEKPLLEVNHIHGHVYSNWLDADPAPQFPVLALTVSGGHNELVFMEKHGDFKVIGESVDDAAGEAFDKTARLLDLGYPGGPVIERRAKEGNPTSVKFPRAQMPGYDFSFSGLKTAVLYHLQNNEGSLKDETFINDTAAAFQEAVVDALLDKLIKAIKTLHPKEVHLAGGVSANRYLRGRIEEALSHMDNPPTFRFPAKMSYCTDNAAMIGAAAYHLNQK